MATSELVPTVGVLGTGPTGCAVCWAAGEAPGAPAVGLGLGCPLSCGGGWGRGAVPLGLIAGGRTKGTREGTTFTAVAPG